MRSCAHSAVGDTDAQLLTGALYVRRRPRVRIEPLMSGGGQERGLRSGTLPAPLAVVRTERRFAARSGCVCSPFL